ncbi:prepilin-type N-terminal cleavage/methylation domain-containing protein [bacterium]|nr:prepilin-type N-terminal cleavage/methylation domain-containing protein [bacterium]
MEIKKGRGFTLLEVLLVIAIIAILAAIVIIAINPGKQLAESRNAQRQTDVQTISNAIYQYMIDNNGSTPTIPTTATEICATTGAVPCTGLVDLGAVLTDKKYVAEWPLEPVVANRAANGIGYTILKDTVNSNRITVAAPDAELSKTISIVR